MAGPISCPSCGTTRQGRYCVSCGERFLTHEDLELKHFFFRHLPDELLHLDGKLMATVRALLLHPGAMPADHVAGRRRPYLDPIRLYIVVYVAFLFLFSAGATHQTLPELAAQDPTGLVAEVIAMRPHVNWQDPQLQHRLETYQHTLAEIGTLGIVFVMAAVQMLLLRRLHRRYLEHLALALSVATVAICLGGAVGAVLAMLRLVGVTASNLGVFGDVSLVVLPVYWYAAIRRFYGIALLPAVGCAALLMVVNVVIANVFNDLVLIGLALAA